MHYPRLVIDEAKIAHNTRVISQAAARHGITVAGVTKVCLADELIVRAMLAGGLTMLADSRVENLERLKSLELGIPLMLLRAPGLSQIEDTVAFADISLNSDYKIMAALAAEARRQKKVHGVIIMVDLGDLREGVWPEDAVPLAVRVERLKGLKLLGLGVNLSCYGGIIPTPTNMAHLVSIARDVEKQIGRKLEIISGGNTSSMNLVYNDEMPEGINNLRIGEGILLGRNTIDRTPLPETYQDCFILQAEVVESYIKPSQPIGIIGQDAFGNVPHFEDKGNMQRAILNLGRQDVPLEGIYPLDPELEIIGASSDHMIIDATRKNGLKVGDIIEFGVNYAGLLGTMTSPFIKKV